MDNSALDCATEVSHLIELVYAGALEALPWETCLQRLNQRFNASWSALVLRPAAPERPSAIIECQEQAVALSTADYTQFERYSSDPFRDLPADQVLTPEEWLGEREWFGSSFYRDYLAPLDIAFQIGADFHPDHYSECRLRLCRPASAGPFSKQERWLCRLLVPHFRQAIQIHTQISRTTIERQLFAEAFDRMRVGTIICDEEGHILTANDTAEQLLADGSALLRSEARLRARNPTDQRALEAALDQLARADNPLRTLSVSRADGLRPVRLLIKAIPQRTTADISNPATVIYIRDPEHVLAPSTDVLRVLFGFTPAESVLARLLAEGLSLDEATEQLRISKNTAKSRLRSLFEKTGTGRQAGLVKLLLDTIVWL